MAFLVGYVAGSALAGLGSAAIGSAAAGSAADKQAAAAEKASQLQYKMFQQQQLAQEPWRQAGMSALYGNGGLLKRRDGGSGYTDPAAARDKFMSDRLSSLNGAIPSFDGTGVPESLRGRLEAQFKAKNQSQAEQEWQDQQGSRDSASMNNYEVDPELTRGFTNEDFVKDPGYDFRMAEGQKAIERSAASRGGLQSGGTLKELTQYGQGFASNEYNNAYNRFNSDRSNRFNRLSSIAGVGQSATNQVGQAGENYANQVGQNMAGAANAQGAAGIAQANQWGGAVNGIGNIGMNATWMKKWLSK